MAKFSIALFTNNLRVSDNPVLRAAIDAGDKVLALYIHRPDHEGAASKWWLHHSLESLQKSLAEHGLALHIRSGESQTAVLKKVIAEIQHLHREAEVRVFEARKYGPGEILAEKIADVVTINASLLFEPENIRNLQGKPYKVYTPFYNALLKRQDEIAEPLAAPRGKVAGLELKSETLKSLKLLPTLDWAKNFDLHWTPGEAGAQAALKKFLKKTVVGYREARDDPSVEGTSRLSPHLHFGEISPQQIWAAVKRNADGRRMSDDESFFLRELLWRDFAYNLLVNFPQTVTEPLRPEFKKFPWKKNPKQLVAWQKGLTGYPIVDAGMRELWQTGFMHNRVRMIVASFLIKDLLQHWQEGAAWFMDTLVDADLANNTFGWQWTAGCGADASPFFRVFNPILQGEKFDPNGDYVKRYVPELSALPRRWIHKPFEADSKLLATLGFKLGQDYPKPIVDHGEARDEALKLFKLLK